MSKSNKVILRLVGGIGNQLFSYAAARRLSVVNDAELVLDDVSGFVRDYDYQRHFQLDYFNISCRKATPIERLEPFSRARRFLKCTFAHLKKFELRSYIIQEGIDFDSRLLDVEIKGTVYLEGYWQSEKYFKDIQSTIKQDLCLVSLPLDTANQSMAKHIRASKAVAIHLRFFDETYVQNGNNVSMDYYINAITKMESLVSEAHFFVFSDRPELACQYLPLASERFTLVEHNRGDEAAFFDIWLMSLCQHFIIANSTFSWWGAWLAEYSCKHVIAPKVAIVKKGCLAAWGFDGLIPPEWIQI